MKSLTEATLEELEQQLRRKREEYLNSLRPKPFYQDDMDWNETIRLCISFVEDGRLFDTQKIRDSIYEAAMKAVFGADVLDRLHKLQDAILHRDE